MNEYVGCESVNLLDAAFHETLELLEWPILCDQLSTFASTTNGQYRCKNLLIPLDIATSRSRLEETIEISNLDEVSDGGLNFQGIHSLEEIILRVSFIS